MGPRGPKEISEMLMIHSVLLLLFTITCVSGIAYRITPANLHLCQLKEAPDQIVPWVRSKLECAVRCSNKNENVPMRCARISYHQELQVCYLFKYRVPVRFYRNLNLAEYLVTYTVQDNSERCLDGFSYIPKLSTCLRVVDVNVTWNEGQCLCNSIHPSSHLLVIQSYKEHSYVSQFAIEKMYPRFPRCFNAKASDSRLWVSGQRLDPSSSSRFVWKPYPGSVVEFTAEASNLWFPGEPYDEGQLESCVHMWLNFNLNSVTCDFLMCSMCQAEPLL